MIPSHEPRYLVYLLAPAFVWDVRVRIAHRLEVSREAINVMLRSGCASLEDNHRVVEDVLSIMLVDEVTQQEEDYTIPERAWRDIVLPLPTVIGLPPSPWHLIFLFENGRVEYLRLSTSGMMQACE